MKGSVDAGNAKLDGLQKDATGQQTNSKLDGVKSSVDAGNAKLDGLQKDATGQQTNAKLDGVKGSVDAGNAKLDGLQKDATGQQTNAKLDGVKGSVDGLGTKLDGLQKDATGQETNSKLDGMGKDLKDVAGEVTKEGDCKTSDCGEGDGGKPGDEEGTDCPYAGDDPRCSDENPWKELLPAAIEEAPTVEDAFQTFRDTLAQGPLGPVLQYQSQGDVSGPCPVFTIPSSRYWDAITVTAHCDVFDAAAPIIYAVMTWAWAFIGLTILLG